MKKTGKLSVLSLNGGFNTFTVAHVSDSDYKNMSDTEKHGYVRLKNREVTVWVYVAKLERANDELRHWAYQKLYEDGITVLYVDKTNTVSAPRDLFNKLILILGGNTFFVDVNTHEISPVVTSLAKEQLTRFNTKFKLFLMAKESGKWKLGKLYKDITY